MSFSVMTLANETPVDDDGSNLKSGVLAWAFRMLESNSMDMVRPINKNLFSHIAGLKEKKFAFKFYSNLFIIYAKCYL